jgi:DNA polymerase elongation subunit (family B)
MQWNISPETLIEDKIESVNQHEIDDRFLNREIISDEKYILSGSGHYFSKTQDGFLPYLMEQMYESRVKVKNEMKDLKQLRDDSVSDKITALNNKQLTLKVLLNSAYGASASPYFRYFDIRLAKSITLSGQLAIKWISEKVNNDMVNTYKLKKDIYVYSDTDSVVGDSLIKTDKGDITIKDLYDQITNDNLIKNKKDDYVKTVDNIKAYAVDKNKNIKLNNIKYIMKHKVRKKLFKIKCNGNEVTVTEDHSIMVERNGEIISVTPNSINKKTDKIIKI